MDDIQSPLDIPHTLLNSQMRPGLLANLRLIIPGKVAT